MHQRMSAQGQKQTFNSRPFRPPAENWLRAGLSSAHVIVKFPIADHRPRANVGFFAELCTASLRSHISIAGLLVMLRITAVLICVASSCVAEAPAGGIDFGETKTRFQALQSRSTSGRAQSDFDWRRAMASQPRRAARHRKNERW
jgi:hypothetical protein